MAPADHADRLGIAVLMEVIAHAGGTDHVWGFVVPAGLILVLLRLAEKRARSGSSRDEELSDAD